MSKDDQEALTWTEKLLRLGMDEVVNHLKRLIAEKQAQAVEIERLRDLLSGIEWVQPAYNGNPSCPACGNQQHWGHSGDCELRSALNTKEQP